MPSTIHQRIRCLRKSRGYTLEQFGALACASKSAAKQWETDPAVDSGNSTVPKLSNLTSLWKATGVSLDWLIDDMADAIEPVFRGCSAHAGAQPAEGLAVADSASGSVYRAASVLPTITVHAALAALSQQIRQARLSDQQKFEVAGRLGALVHSPQDHISVAAAVEVALAQSKRAAA